jgi:uncharacterized membrane protein
MKKSKLSLIVLCICLVGVIHITQSTKEIEVTPEFNPYDGLTFIVLVGIISAISSIYYFKNNK